MRSINLNKCGQTLKNVCVFCEKVTEKLINTHAENVRRKEKNMFEKFGEMDSYKEINELAENLFNEEDLDSLKAMAAENGIPEGYVDLYQDGEIPYLCDPAIAAIGKLDIECKDLQPKEIMEDWVEYIKGQCLEKKEIALKVRKKGKTLKGCIAELLKWSFKNQIPVDKEIVKAAGVSAGRVTLGIPGMARAKEIITDYYMEGEKA